MDQEFFFELFKNASVLGLGLYLFSAAVLLLFRNPVSQLHSQMMDLPVPFIKEKYFGFLANFKMLLLVFIWIPFLALWMMRG